MLWGGYTGAYGIPRYQRIIDYIVWIIYTFHMPLFFCLSGYVYRLANAKVEDLDGYKGLIRKKAIKLMVPYYVCSTIQILIKLPLQGKIASELSWINILLLPIHAIDQYWFIYTLFICYALMAFLEWKNKSKKMNLCIAIGMWLLIIPINAFIVNSVLWYIQIIIHLGEVFIFFYFGAMLYDLRYKATIFHAVICSVIFLLLQGVVYFSEIDFGIGISFVRCCLAITATMVVIYVASTKIIEGLTWLRYVGRNSMSIYIVHVVLCAAIRILLYKVGITNFAVHLILGIGLSVLIPLFLQQIWSALRLKI